MKKMIIAASLLTLGYAAQAQTLTLAKLQTMVTPEAATGLKSTLTGMGFETAPVPPNEMKMKHAADSYYKHKTPTGTEAMLVYDFIATGTNPAKGNGKATLGARHMRILSYHVANAAAFNAIRTQVSGSGAKAIKGDKTTDATQAYALPNNERVFLNSRSRTVSVEWSVAQ